MSKKNLRILGIILISLFTLSIFTGIINQGIIPANNQKKLENDPILDIKDKDIIKEEPINKKSPKTAGPIETGLNFSFDVEIHEIANNSFSYVNYNSTGGGYGGKPPTNFMFQWFYYSTNASFEFYLTDLINATSPTKDELRPNDFAGMAYSCYAGPIAPGGWEQFTINDDGPGQGNASGYCHLGYIAPIFPFGASTISYTYTGLTNITYNGTLYFFNAISNNTAKASFKPTIENTQTDLIEWELNYDNRYFNPSPYDLPDQYRAEILLDDSFIVGNVKGRSPTIDDYWDALPYYRNSTHLIIYGSYEEYKITFYSPNYVSITYNDKLEMYGLNELRLNVTCKMDGNLRIEFTDTNGTTDIYETPVQNMDIINYNYIMLNHSKGGIAILNVTLTDGSDIKFGTKIVEVELFKRAQIIGFTENTTVFNPQFGIGAVLLDVDYAEYLTNVLGYNFKENSTEIFNRTMISNATVTYKLLDYGAELNYVKHPYQPLNLWLYLNEIDLGELQIPPRDDYNITFTASKTGYSYSEFVLEPWIVYKRNVTVKILGAADELEVEQEFSLTISLSVNYTTDQGFVYMIENYLKIPVTVNLTFINNATGEMDGPHPWGQQIVQSFTLLDPEGNLPKISNDTIPGFYRVNITIDSNYYQGSAEHAVEILKKELEISVDYSGIIKESKNTNFTWNLEEGNFKGNRENMTIEILIDNISTKNVSLASNSSGYNLFSFTPGVHNMTYRLISPFYIAEETIKFTVEAKPVLAPPADDDDDDGKDKEENILLWFIIIGILIAVSILAVFLLISRHKVKAQRELDSELVALKTKTTASEQKISLIEAQISEIASIYWIIIVHSEQGTTMIEISDFRFGEVLDEKYKHLIGKGMMRDSALIGGFLTAIRNFSRETSDTSLEYQPVFNSQTDYSTIVDDNEIHRRILEGTNYFMAFVSSRGTIEISDVLSSVNTLFQEEYGEMVEKFNGAVSPFRPFEETVVEFLHNEIRELQKKFKEEELLLGQFEGHLKEVQEKIGIKPKKSADLDYK